MELVTEQPNENNISDYESGKTIFKAATFNIHLSIIKRRY